jgi:methylamine---glutamate N-methyltransferase subunit A
MVVLRGNEGRMERYKEVGLPADVATRFGLPVMTATRAFGNTCMATESAVITDWAHPYTAGCRPKPRAQR